MRISNDFRFLVIVHQEPQLKVTLTGSESARQETSAHTTDGQTNTNIRGGKEVRSKTFWEGSRLVTEWLSDRVRHRQIWSLSPDAKRLTIEMRDGEHEALVVALKQ